MKRAGAEAPAIPANQRESTDERDARMEVRWVYDRRGERSTLAFVDAYRDELVAEFFAWRRENYQGDVLAAVERWEVVRFGSVLDRAPHGVLLFAVRCMLDPEDGGRRLPPSYRGQKSLPPKVTPRDPDRLAAHAARGHEMPRTRLSHRAVDERLRVLGIQAEGMREPGEDSEEL